MQNPAPEIAEAASQASTCLGNEQPNGINKNPNPTTLDSGLLRERWYSDYVVTVKSPARKGQNLVRDVAGPRAFDAVPHLEGVVAMQQLDRLIISHTIDHDSHGEVWRHLQSGKPLRSHSRPHTPAHYAQNFASGDENFVACADNFENVRLSDRPLVEPRRLD